MRARAGSGQPYIPRLALQGLFDDDTDLFGDPLGTDDPVFDDDNTGAPDVTSGELYESGPDQSAIIAATGTYDASTGQVIQPNGLPASATGIAAGIASIFSGVARIFGGGANAAQINATGISTDGEETSLMPLLLVAAGAGVLYLALRDQS